jgi:4-hydroxy-2-oxoheptanedioate aldolase
MKPRSSRLLKKIRDGHSATAVKTNLSDPRIIELAGLSGFDAVWICNEHVPNDWLNLEHQIRAARLHDMDTLVRVAKGSYSDYVRPLEADATGLIVPHVASADEARHIVQLTRFQPIGRRALDSGNVDAQFCQIPLTEYLRHSNTERVLIFQIESPEALRQVDQIAAVPGYDGLMFGPGDFSHLVGKVGQLNDPEVIAARKRVATAAQAHGKFAMSAGMFDQRGVLESEGHRVFCLGADVLGLPAYYQRLLDEFSQSD